MNTKSDTDSIYHRLILLLMRAKRQMFLIAESMQLTPVQGMLLISLDVNSSKTMNELADMLGCDASNCTGLIDRLEANGYILRRADTKDRRVKKIYLSDKGVKCRQNMLDELKQADALDINKLTAEEVKALNSIVYKLT